MQEDLTIIYLNLILLIFMNDRYGPDRLHLCIKDIHFSFRTQHQFNTIQKFIIDAFSGRPYLIAITVLNRQATPVNPYLKIEFGSLFSMETV